MFDLVKVLEEIHGTISDIVLIDNLRDLKRLMPIRERDVQNRVHSVQYRKWEIGEGLLDSVMGRTYNLDNLNKKTIGHVAQ